MQDSHAGPEASLRKQRTPQRCSLRATGHQGNRPAQKVPAGPSSRSLRARNGANGEGSEWQAKGSHALQKEFLQERNAKKIIIVVGGRGARQSVCITFLFSKFSTSVFYFYNQKVKYCKEEETERCWAGTQPGRAAAPPRPGPAPPGSWPAPGSLAKAGRPHNGIGGV